MARYSRHIDIYAEQKDGKVEFRMEEDFKPVPKKNGVECLVFNKRKEGMKKDDVHEVHFQLHAKANCPVVFTKNKRNVMWVERIDSIADPCPCPGDCDPDEEFYVEDVNENQKRITVINKNMDCQLFAFRLNFVEQGNDDVIAGNDYFRYDPITENQNGSMIADG